MPAPSPRLATCLCASKRLPLRSWVDVGEMAVVVVVVVAAAVVVVLYERLVPTRLAVVGVAVVDYRPRERRVHCQFTTWLFKSK